MSSHINKNQENQDMVSSNTFMPMLGFADSSKRSPSNTHDESGNIKRVRLDSKVGLHQTGPPHSHVQSIGTDIGSALEMEGAMTPGSHLPHHSLDHASPAGHASSFKEDEHSCTQPLRHSRVHDDDDDDDDDGPLSMPAFQHTTENVDFVSTPSCSTPVNELLAPQQSEMELAPPTPPTSALDQDSKLSLATPTTKPMSKSLRKCTVHNRVKKFRSRSLPNIIFNSVRTTAATTRLSKATSTLAVQSQQPPPLPPVNIQSLREIDLAEILKNPQLRHDILFDPQLQFRPNLDGERGRRKKITYDKYWSGVRDEIESYYIQKQPFVEEFSRLPNLFNTLKDILISLLPSKDKTPVIEILDIDLIMQQLSQHSLDFVGLATWLSTIFKSHCAPMRDPWVDEMITLFHDADSESSLTKLVEGLRLIFTILEAMKLDVANHQIRMLRPVLVQTAVNFERDYFSQMISRCKLEISDSLNWFKRFHANLSPEANSPRDAIVPSILCLLSCSNMVSEFPSSLAFDHARLIVLRANVRQVVCLQLCLALYKQLVAQNNSNSLPDRSQLVSETNLNKLKKEVLAIITDDNGNVKWTRNIGAIALQLVRRSSKKDIETKDLRIDFAFNWLIKQTQPSSPVYALMEQRVFKMIAEHVAEEGDELCTKTVAAPSSTTSTSSTNAGITATNSTSPSKKAEDHDDITGIASRIALLTKFHWSVFGTYYTEAVI